MGDEIRRTVCITVSHVDPKIFMIACGIAIMAVGVMVGINLARWADRANRPT